MTTKYKIVLGFLLSSVMLLAVAVIGYRSINRSTLEFDRYRVVATATTDLKTMASEIYRQGYNLEMFLVLRDAAYSREALAGMKRCAEMGSAVQKSLSIKENKEAVQKIIARCTEYVELITSIETNMLAWQSLYIDTLRPAADELQRALLTMGNGAKGDGNIFLLGELAEVGAVMIRLSTQITLFAQSGNPAIADAMDKEFAALQRRAKMLDSYMVSESGRNDHARFMSALGALKKSADAGKTFFVSVNANVGKIHTYHAEIMRIIDEVGVRTDGVMGSVGTEMVAANADAQTRMFAVSAAGAVISICCAVFIVLGLARMLRRLGGYASAVAAGRFSHDSGITEKGEIGLMLEALREIPKTLSGVVGECNAVATRIVSGDFRKRLDETRFQGGFVELASGINAVADAYTKVIDELPTGIMSIDAGRNLIFQNEAAQGFSGGNSLAELSGCYAEGSDAAGEVTVEGRNGPVHLSLMAIPLYDRAGEQAGCMEIISDVTSIKNQQITIQEVARKALDISDRVAAASEELSAQVEQVSRGAAVQREQVESTAGAMVEMNATVLEVAKSAGAASEQSEDTRGKADEGAELVNKVKIAINTVNSVGQSLQANMRELGRQAESIGSVMNVISDIADQTNLLALNAAIEAARAGEAGRGFAVVADEVRKLAEKTMSATQEVGSSIKAVQQSARTNVEEVGKAVDSVAAANELANSSGEALAKIVSLASSNSSLVASIATAAEQQSATSEEINRAVEGINKIVGETSDGMAESSRAVADLSRMAQELKHVLEDLK